MNKYNDVMNKYKKGNKRALILIKGKEGKNPFYKLFFHYRSPYPLYY